MLVTLRKLLHTVSLPKMGHAAKGTVLRDVVSELDSESGLPALGVELVSSLASSSVVDTTPGLAKLVLSDKHTPSSLTESSSMLSLS